MKIVLRAVPDQLRPMPCQVRCSKMKASPASTFMLTAPRGHPVSGSTAGRPESRLLPGTSTVAPEAGSD